MTRIFTRIIFSIGVAVLPLTFAVNADAAICGYAGEDDGYSNKATYTNCSDRNEKIEVEYTYAKEKMYVSPGGTTLYANPNLGAVRNAHAVGSC